MMAWSIEAALESGCFDKVVVTTDDTEIAEVACQHGAHVPFLRPAALSDDHTSTNPVIAHAIDWMNSNVATVELACCLYATAPFVSPNDIIKGLRILSDTGCDYTFSVTSYVFPIQRALYITPENRVRMFQPDHFSSRSQDLEEAWHDAGQFYWGRAEAWLAGRPAFTSDAAPVVLPRYRVQDIDTPEDWTRAELMFRALHNLG
jgi:N-acylneuraminate cytidylyltransferase